MMFNKIKGFLKKWFHPDVKSIKAQYLALLVYESDNSIRPDDLHQILFGFFREVELEDISTLSVRELMSVEAELNHPHIAYLLATLEMVNGFLRMDDDVSMRLELSKDFNATRDVFLDSYFVDGEHIPQSVSRSLRRLHTLLEEQEQLLAGFDHSLYTRLLSRVYEDIRTLMFVLVNQMEDTPLKS